MADLIDTAGKALDVLAQDVITPNSTAVGLWRGAEPARMGSLSGIWTTPQA